VSNRGGRDNVKNTIYTDLKYQGETPFDYQYTLNLKKEKKEERERKRSLFWGWIPVGGGGHKERQNEGEYGGCILHPYMEIEE
jgi:hypothetical protein